MSSSNRPSTASNVDFSDYLDRVYDQNMKESEAAYAAHLKASKELHQATVAMMRSRHAASALRADLDKANAAAASATETVDRKRKAADEAAADFDSCAQIARHCYGSKAAAEEHESQDPYGGETPCYNPVSKDYVPQKPCASPVYHVNSPKGYCSITGEPIYSPNEVTKPRSPRYSATSPSYTPQSPSPIPLSPHVLAAAKRAGLRWGK